MILPTLRLANRLRQKEWDPKGTFDLSFKSNEVMGEIGEAIESVLDLMGHSLALAAIGGRAANIVKKLERERLGRPGSRASRQELAAELADIIICVDLLAMHEDIDLNRAVVEKFNAASDKLGLQTKLAV